MTTGLHKKFLGDFSLKKSLFTHVSKGGWIAAARVRMSLQKQVLYPSRSSLSHLPLLEAKRPVQYYQGQPTG
jgi:hypothetical protein